MDKVSKEILNIEKIDYNGYAWISDGYLYVKDELEGGIPPLISPSKNVKLLLNGVEIKSQTFVSSKDKIELIPKISKESKTLEIIFSNNNMEAYINYIPGKISKNELIDLMPANKLNIEVKKSVLRTTSYTNIEEIQNLIKKTGIKHGLLNTTIKFVSVSKKSGKYQIAKGSFPEETISDKIEYVLKEIKNNNSEQKKFNDVSAGKIICILHRGKRGKFGMDILGNEIPSKEYKKINLLLDKSVFLNKETGEIKALKAGIPTIEKNKNTIRIFIVEKLSLLNVDNTKDRISFSGDIEIFSNVNNIKLIESKNNITIQKNISNTNLVALNNIIVKGSVFYSHIESGADYLISKDPYSVINQTLKELKKLCNAINNLDYKIIKNNNLNTFPRKIRYLLNSSEKKLCELIYKNINELSTKKYNISNTLLHYVISKLRLFMGDCKGIENINFIEDIISSLSDKFHKLDLKILKSNVFVDNLTNSSIISKGKVTVKGKGIINSKIYAKDSINLFGKSKSGEIFSEKNIYATECGSIYGSNICLSVPEHGKITIGIAHTDTTIKIGKFMHKFAETSKNIEAYFDEKKSNFRILF